MEELLMELCILDVEDTQVEISVNGGSEVEIKESLDILDEVLANANLGVEDTIISVGDSYVTSIDNATYYKELGWIFSKVTIKNL